MSSDDTDHNTWILDWILDWTMDSIIPLLAQAVRLLRN